jgi:hypothetical protein
MPPTHVPLINVQLRPTSARAEFDCARRETMRAHWTATTLADVLALHQFFHTGGSEFMDRAKKFHQACALP